MVEWMGKEPISNMQYQDLQQSAMNHNNPDALKIIQLIRYTGMHICVVSDPNKYNFHIEKDYDGKYIVWNRPKKNGLTAYVSIKQSRIITYDVNKFIQELRKRRFESDSDPNSKGKHYRISRIYWYNLIVDVGEKAGLKKVSPLSLRHTFAVLSLPVLGEDLTQQKMNCTTETLRSYKKHTRETEKEIYARVNW